MKQVFRERGWGLPSGASWHRDLLMAAEDHGVIPAIMNTKLREYLAFRHFFTHAYVLDVNPQRMEFLVDQLPDLFKELKDVFKESCEDAM
ncbi:MAG: hypothetical protein EOL88_07650 [Bacteroidia bacterium]|nr:hypothetical protein [Bacteroidia bacterium]